MSKKDNIKIKDPAEMTEKDHKRREQIGELLRYLIVGTITTLINWGVSAIFKEVFGISGGFNSIIAWIISVVFFAFWAYKFFVFRSKTMEKKALLYEFVSFIAARLFTLGFEALFMFIFVDALGFDQVLRFGFTRLVDGADAGSFALNIKEFYIFKFLATVVVTILNYIFSKLVIFNKKKRIPGVGDIEVEDGESATSDVPAPAPEPEVVGDAAEIIGDIEKDD